MSQKPPKFPMFLSVQDLEYVAISLHVIVQESMCYVILDPQNNTARAVKLRKGINLNSPGKIQVQLIRILQGSPLQLQSQLEQARSQQQHLLSY